MAKKLIVVTGATGNQGGSIARGLLKTGEWHVRAVTRNASGEKAQKLAAVLFSRRWPPAQFGIRPIKSRLDFAGNPKAKAIQYIRKGTLRQQQRDTEDIL
jgi:NAD(P)-dependent dehydrogenase (short-subunit alcohol dehydrogenase family)